MKLTYIVLPSENREYLIRCVSAALRQVGADCYVIVAENRLDDEQRLLLCEKEKVLLISENAKTDAARISEAVSLVFDDSDYIFFLQQDAVIAPCAAKQVAENSKSASLVAINAAVSGNKGFEIDSDSYTDNESYLLSMSPFRFYYSRCELSQIDKFFDNTFAFYLHKAILLAEEKLVYCNEICLYLHQNISLEPPTNEDYTKNTDTVEQLFDKIADIKNLKADILKKCLDSFIEIVLSEKETPEMRIKAFEVIKKAAKSIESSPEIADCFAIYTGFTPLQIAEISCQDYIQLNQERTLKIIEELQNSINSLIAPQNEVANRLDENVKTIVDFQAQIKELLNPQSEITNKLNDTSQKLTENTQMIILNLHSLSQSVANLASQNEINAQPQQIVQFFYNGKLGLKTILRCFKAWLGYKIGGKMK